MSQAILVTMRKPDVRKKFEDMGLPLVSPERATPNYLAQFVRRELQKWASPVQSSGVSGKIEDARNCAGKDQGACKTIQACTWVPETGNSKGYCRVAPARQ
jgi:hypothetical protein